MRILFLWQRPSGYILDCLNALADRGHHVAALFRKPSTAAPFEIPSDGQVTIQVVDDADLTAKRVQTLAEQTAPEIVFTSSWHIPAYRTFLQQRGSLPSVLCMDNYFRFRLKQIVGIASAPFYLHPLYDHAFVPGKRQARFARMLGFENEAITRGLYCASDAFDAGLPGIAPPKSFLYVGRLAPEKNIAGLLDGYMRYHECTPDPWPLAVLGGGPESERVKAAAKKCPGIVQHGFVQPKDLPDAMRKHGCFVLFSHVEPWGLVIHEAAKAGLPVMCSKACGAAEDYVRDGESGRILAGSSPAAIAEAFAWMHGHEDAARHALAQRSYALGQSYDARLWAKQIEKIGRTLTLPTGSSHPES